MQGNLTRNLIAACILLSGVYETAWGNGSCVLTLSGANTVTVSSYKGIVESAPTVQQLSFVITNGTGTECDYLVTVSSGNNLYNGSRAMNPPSGATGSSGSSSPTGTSSMGNLPYDILDGSRKIIGDANTTNLSDDNVLKGTVAANNTKTVTVQVSIPAGALLPASGLAYTDTVTLKLYHAASVSALSGVTPDVTQDLKIEAYVKPQLTVALCDKGTEVGHVDQLGYTLSLGDLSQGVKKEMDVVINGNDGYVLSFQSDNKGRLQKQVQVPLAADTDESYIPYVMTIGQTNLPYTLSGDTAGTVSDPSNPKVDAGTVISGINQGRITLRFNVSKESTKMALAGTYRDNITVTVQNP